MILILDRSDLNTQKNFLNSKNKSKYERKISEKK